MEFLAVYTSVLMIFAYTTLIGNAIVRDDKDKRIECFWLPCLLLPCLLFVYITVSS